MQARSTRVVAPLDRIDDVVARLAQQVEDFRRQPGHRGLTTLVDRSAGAIVAISFWEDQQALEGSETFGSGVRARTAQQLEGQVVERWQVALDDRP